MADHARRSQLTRLMQLILALQASPYPSARQLADLCEVSMRTIYRDLETLKMAGVPVQYFPERQGYKLAPGFVFQPPNLKQEEVEALILLTQVGSGEDALGLRRNGSIAAWKIINILQSVPRARVLALADMVQSRTEALDRPPPRQAIYDAVLESLKRGVQLRIVYFDPETLALNSTRISPYRLLVDGPRCYLVGRSTLHRQVRTFWLPWIHRAEVTDDTYTIPPRFEIKRYLGNAWRVERGRPRVEVSLRFSALVSPEIQEHLWHQTQRLKALEDGRTELRMTLDGIDEVLGWILSFGNEVEALDPPSLRERLRTLALEMAARYAGDPPAGPELGPS